MSSKEMIMKLHDSLNMIKGFECAFRVNNPTQMIIDYKGDRYVVSLDIVSKPGKNIYDDVCEYL